MIKKKSLLQIIVIFITAVAVTAILPNVSKAAISSTGYDFEKVEVGTSKTTIARITNLEETDTLISGIVFANTTCSDFSVVYTPDNQTIPAKETMEVEISYTPSTIGTCSDTLKGGNCYYRYWWYQTVYFGWQHQSRSALRGF